jgi:transcriptional regulator of acetoin/glycerol metabolism
MKLHHGTAEVVAIRRAHGQFLSDGRIPGGIVPEFVERSWQRSAAFGVASDRIRDVGRVDQAGLRIVADQYAHLISLATPVMDNLHHQLAGSGSVVLLCNHEGFILRSIGDPEFLPKAQRVALEPGVSWAENQKGTNAICAAIIERRPVVIYAGHHYIRQNQFLACSAAPVLDPFGRVVGVLDITCDYRSHERHTLALVRMSVNVIERAIFRHRFSGDLLFNAHPEPSYLGSPFDVQLAFSPHGEFLAATPATCSRLGLEPGMFHGRFDELFDAPLERVLDELQSASTSRLRLRLRHGGEPVFLQLALAPDAAHGFADAVPGRSSRSRPVSAGAPREALKLEGLGATDPALLLAIDRARRTLGRSIPMLIEGETGTGKEWFALAIHNSGPHAAGEFVSLNCAALQEDALAAALFGIDGVMDPKDAGAPGRIRRAHGGTLFLDEIGEMPMALQARLLGLVETCVGAPQGASVPAGDISVVCATRHRLSDLVRAGEFREDLYYRLNGLTVVVPPLRNRTDIVALAQLLAEEERAGSRHAGLSAEVLEIFAHHPWPGNVRQMRSVIRAASAMVNDGEEVGPRHLPMDFLAQMNRNAESASEARGMAGSLETIELQAIQETLRVNSGNVSAAARQLGVSRTTLYRKLRQPDASPR